MHLCVQQSTPLKVKEAGDYEDTMCYNILFSWFNQPIFLSATSIDLITELLLLSYGG